MNDAKPYMNKPGSAITQSLRGMALSHPDTIKVHFDPDFVERLAPAPSGKVAVDQRQRQRT